MKTVVLLVLLLAGTASAHSQSLKDLLYSGKLKSDTGSVVRKTDDLSTKIDTTTRKPVESEKPKQAVATSVTGTNAPAVQAGAPADSTAVASGPKDNNKIWKDYMDELTGALRTEVLPSKKIKEGDYYVVIDYQIGTDGQVTVNNVSASPDSPFLEQQIKERITLTAPQLTPLLNNYGKPRVAAKKQTLTLSK